MAGTKTDNPAGNVVSVDNGDVKPAIGETKGKSQDDNGDKSGALQPTELAGGTGNGGERYERDSDGAVKFSPATGKPLKKRGRKPKSRNGNGASTTGTKTGAKTGAPHDTALAVETLSKVLMAGHLSVAMVTKFDDFALDKSEADLLADATANVMREFEITPDPKMIAVTGLIGAAGHVYVPRVMLYKMQKKKEAKNAPVDVTGKIGENKEPKKSATKEEKVADEFFSNPNNFNLAG